MSDSLRPLDCSTPGFPGHHQHPELAQTHVHIESVMTSKHLTLYHPLLNLRSILPSIRLFWSFSFSINPSSEYSGLISFRIDWLDILAGQATLKFSPTPQYRSINSSALNFLYGPTLTPIHDYRKNHSFE